MNTRDPPSGNPLCKQSFRFSLDLCWYLWDGFTSSKKNHHGGIQCTDLPILPEAGICGRLYTGMSSSAPSPVI